MTKNSLSYIFKKGGNGYLQGKLSFLGKEVWNHLRSKESTTSLHYFPHFSLTYKEGESHFLVARALANQSIDWSRPSPLIADVLNIWKVLVFKASKPNAE